jgi:hypothetical protein
MFGLNRLDMAPDAGHVSCGGRLLAVTLTRENIWLWLAGGLAAVLTGAAFALWAAYGPVVFINALTAAWTCL